MSMNPMPPVSAPVSPIEGDDTFSEMNVPGPVIKLTGDHGYETYTLLNWEENTKIDARGAVWKSHMMCQVEARCADEAKNNYPIQIGADWNGSKPTRMDLYNHGLCPDPGKKLYWFGGVIVGTAPLSISWDLSKNSNGGGMTMNALGSVTDGVRIHNLHDPFLPLAGNGFVLKNSWITFSRDDAIENDAFAEGLIEDNFIEGFYYFYSSTNAGNTKKAPAYGEACVAPGSSCNGHVLMKNNLVAFQQMNGLNGKSWGGMWKDWDRAPVPCGKRNPKVDFINNIVYIPSNGGGDCDLQPRWAGEVKDNVVVDMKGCASATGGYKVLRGAEGEAFWKKALADWKRSHPLVERIKGTDDDYDEWLANMTKPSGE